MGSSRLTSAPSRMCENEVRSHVSGARSAAKDPGLTSSAVRQTPLTATLSPVLSSLGVLSAAMVIRRTSPRCRMPLTRPTSSMMPVNIWPPWSSLKRNWGGSLPVWISHISLHREFLPKAMQFEDLSLGGFVQVAKAGACREGNRVGSRQNFGRVIEKDFVHNP